MQYKNLDYFLNHIDEPNRTGCLGIFNDNKERIEKSPGSLTKHQAWEGGYINHLEEAMNVAFGMFEMLNGFRPLDFTLSDALLILFLHDLEKPFRYVEPKQELDTENEKKAFVQTFIDTYNIVLTKNHENALHYIHGEGDDYSRTINVQKPLAAFVHLCDTVSARIWHEYPKNDLNFSEKSI